MAEKLTLADCYKYNKSTITSEPTIFPSFEDYKIEYERRSKCDFPHPTMQPHEAYMIGFNQCYQWIRHEVLKLTEVKND